jgi:hypothetical protein
VVACMHSGKVEGAFVHRCHDVTTSRVCWHSMGLQTTLLHPCAVAAHHEPVTKTLSKTLIPGPHGSGHAAAGQFPSQGTHHWGLVIVQIGSAAGSTQQHIIRCQLSDVYGTSAAAELSGKHVDAVHSSCNMICWPDTKGKVVWCTECSSCFSTLCCRYEA